MRHSWVRLPRRRFELREAVSVPPGSSATGVGDVMGSRGISSRRMSGMSGTDAARMTATAAPSQRVGVIPSSGPASKPVADRCEFGPSSGRVGTAREGEERGATGDAEASNCSRRGRHVLVAKAPRSPDAGRETSARPDPCLDGHSAHEVNACDRCRCDRWTRSAQRRRVPDWFSAQDVVWRPWEREAARAA